MRATQEYRIGDRSVLVFDGLLKPLEVARVQAMFVQVPFARTESFDGELNYGMTSEEFTQFPHLPELLDVLFLERRDAMGITDRDVGFGHAYAGVFHSSDNPVRHTDGQTDQAMSFVYYANAHWDESWCGETLFFDEEGNEAVRVPIRPGRIAAFHANLLHSASAPAPHAALLRHTISAFYYAA